MYSTNAIILADVTHVLSSHIRLHMWCVKCCVFYFLVCLYKCEPHAAKTNPEILSPLESLAGSTVLT